jgi:hypothetical protein
VHGYYLYIRIKNTPQELSRYDRRFNRLLHRVFDEYGLIICGWSAEWDTALRAALERCSTHRFTTFWAARGKIGKSAEKLITLRRAQLISIREADAFFRDLTEKVKALDELPVPHPQSAQVAVANLKRYLTDDRHKIRLHDLMMQETDRLSSQLSDEQFPIQGISSTPQNILKEIPERLLRYEKLSDVLLALMITGCYWGEDSQKIFGQNAWSGLQIHQGQRAV